MKISELINEIPHSLIQGDLNTEITHISRNSRKVGKDGLFFCIKGLKSDGHDFAKQAVEQGAKALVVERDIQIEDESVVVIKVEHVRREMALIAANFYQRPANKMKLIAVIGTKGKTTTAFMIRELLIKNGYRVGLIGTIMIHNGVSSVEASFTTPESDDLQKYLCEMQENGCDYVVMEVSSQSYPMYRTHGLTFDYGVFTNISPDHIGEGEHKDFEDYFSCKQQLLKQCKLVIYNADADLADKMISPLTSELFSFSVGNKADIIAKDVVLKRDKDNLGVTFTVGGKSYELSVPGEFNVHNALAVIALAGILKIEHEILFSALKQVKIPGRMEPVSYSDDFTLLIDYAHNAMALESTLEVLRKYNPERLVCLFGCGGNRDKNRRFEMGEVSGNLADLTIATSDNPRFEEPEAIVEDIITGLKKTKGAYIKIVDRREAIQYILNHAKKGDIILLAGKGHETYQEIKGVKYPMDERDIIRECK